MLKKLSLRRQVVFIIAITISILGMIFFILMNNYERDKYLHEIEASTFFHLKLIKTELHESIDGYRKGIRFLSYSPMVNSLLEQNQTGRTQAFREAQVKNLFIAFMQANPDYLQVRLLSIDNKGQELVRINRRNNLLETVEQPKLQRKGHRDYFINTQKLNPGEVYISDINLNREYGAIEMPQQPTFRISTPLFSNNKMLGMLVINIDANYLLDKIQTRSHTKSGFVKQFYLLNSKGQYLLHPETNKAFAFEYTQTSPWQDDFKPLHNDNSSISNLVKYANHQQTWFVAQVRLELDKRREDGFLQLVALIPPSALDEMVSASRNKLIFGALISAAFIGLFITLYLRRILDPLSKLTLAAKNLVHGSEPEFEIEKNSLELRTLIDAFNKMKADLAQREQDNKNVYDALQKKEQQATAIFEGAPEAMLIVNQKGRILRSNDFFKKVFGYDNAEIIGEKVEILLPERYHEQHVVLRNNYDFTSRVIGMDRELYARRKNGEEFAMILCLSAIELDGETCTIAGIRDINARVLAEKKAQQYLQALETSNKELDNFAYVASHDLKAPLRGIKTLVGWLVEDMGDNLPESCNKHVDLIHSRIKRLDKLLTDLLTYSRVGRVKQDYNIINLREVIESTFNLLFPPTSGFKLKIQTEVETIKLLSVPFETVLRNLLSNAIKHHDKSHGEFLVMIKQESVQALLITIQDDGPGIEQKYHERIFEMFQTLQSRDEVEGSGMGLALVKKILETYGGTIRLESAPGQGARFIFTWPLPSPGSFTWETPTINVEM